MNAQDPTRQSVRAGVVALGMVAFASALISSSSYGIGVSPDSVEYFAAAESLAGGEGYRTVNGDPMTLWPPLYPSLLSVGCLLGIPALTFARWLHAVLAAVTAWVVGGFLMHRIRWWPLVLLTVATCITSLPMVTVQSFAWSDPLFIPLTLFTLAGLSRYLTALRRRDLLWTALAAAGACLTRYPGIVVVAVAACCVLAAGPGGLRQRIRQGSAFTLLAVAPLGTWLIRNLLVSGSATGPRIVSTTSLMANLDHACQTVNSWLLPRDVTRLTDRSTWLNEGIALLIGAGVVGLVVAAARSRDLAGRRTYLNAVVPLVIFVPVYLAFMAISAASTAIDPLGSRLLSPMYAPILLAACLAIDRLLHGMPSCRLRETRRAWAALAMAVLLLLTADQGKKRLLYLAREGQGYTSRFCRQRSLSADVALLPKEDQNRLHCQWWGSLRDLVPPYRRSPVNGPSPKLDL